MKVGSLCVSEINFTPRSDDPPGTILPIKDVIYTVRGFISINGKDGIWLEEIINDPHQWNGSFGEMAFYINHFREIQPPLSIDIELLIEQPLEHV